MTLKKFQGSSQPFCKEDNICRFLSFLNRCIVVLNSVRNMTLKKKVSRPFVPLCTSHISPFKLNQWCLHGLYHSLFWVDCEGSCAEIVCAELELFPS